MFHEIWAARITEGTAKQRPGSKIAKNHVNDVGDNNRKISSFDVMARKFFYT